MKNKIIKSRLDYDIECDAMGIDPIDRVPSDYKISECLDDNIIFDLDKENNIIGLEVLNCSEVFNISKQLLNSISKSELSIVVEEKIIKINIKFSFKLRNKINQSSHSIEKINSELLKPSQINLAVA